MKNKPFIFTFLSILCLIEPAIKVLYFKATTHFDFMVIISNLQARNSFMEVFDFWLVFPIAGALILKLRKWTYFTFMSILAYIIYNISTYEKYTWPYNSDSPFMYNYIVVMLSVAVFVSFLFPQVRKPFFDRRIRWWEPQTRYNVQISCRLHSSFLSYSAQMMNISRTGAFLEDAAHLRVGDRLTMEFNFLGQNIEVPIIVVHQHTIQNQTGYGVKFAFKSFGQSIKIAKVISVIRRSHGLFKEPKESKLVA